MYTCDLIQKKRDGKNLSANEINHIINSYHTGHIKDYQMSALTMAIFFNGMSDRELISLTKAMLYSGKIIKLPDNLYETAIDKHSTGGVGDKISIPLAPAVAACGVIVPMISGRSLTHTGGTLDKLESIPGFKTDLTEKECLKLLNTVGCCLIGQTKEIAPVDKKLYALRDVTGTVESIPLIASSILSKKLAEGTSGLVLDVKFGSGALIKSHKQALILAKAMVNICNSMEKKIIAQMTNMDQPLGIMVGNSLEIKESIDILQGSGPVDVRNLTIALGAEMLVMAKLAANLKQGKKQIIKVLDNGQALQKFAEIIEHQGGNPNILDNQSLLPQTNKKLEFKAQSSGFVNKIETKEVGIASLLLGGGRHIITDAIDPRVGIEVKVKVGDRINKGSPLCILHIADKPADAAIEKLKNGFLITEEAVPPLSLFAERITINN